MPFSRRDILSHLGFGLGLLPALALAPRSLLGDLLFEPDGEVVPVKPLPANPFIQEGRAVVVLVHGEDVPALLQAGLDLLGGLDGLHLRTKRVLVKPNVVNDRPPPSTTSPQVVGTVVDALRSAGADEVVVADSSGIIRFPTSDNLLATGIQQIAETKGARVLSLDRGPWVRVEPAAAQSLSHFYVSKLAYETDVFINLPVVKTHRFAAYSCSLKNLVGIIHPRYRPSVTFLAGDWHERIAELNLAVHPHLTIADATTLMIAGGPTSGTPARANVLLLSGDRIALDAVAVALIRTFGAWPRVTEKEVWDQRQIRKAIELGLGVESPKRVKLVAHSLSKPNRRFDQMIGRIQHDLGIG